MTKHRILVAGHGQMGRAFETLLQGNAVTVWNVAPGKTGMDDATRAAAAGTELAFLCVPTLAIAAVLKPLQGVLAADAAVLSIAKGLDDTGATAADILAASLPGRPWGVLGGPMIAAEIDAGRGAYAELGTHDPVLPDRLDALFARERLRLTLSRSPRAVSWCGVLKNVYAMLIGLADGFNLGANVRGHLIMGALAEMRVLVPILAGEEATVFGDAGLADFAATVTSPDSHHYALGRDMARGEDGARVCEGMHSLRVLRPAPDARHHPLYATALALLEGTEAARTGLHAWLEGRARR